MRLRSNVFRPGGGKAEGTDRLFSDQEAQDYYEAIDWASAQPWSSGRIGLLGVSYLALSQYRVAGLRPPHLAAICPWKGFSDFYRDSARGVMWTRRRLDLTTRTLSESDAMPAPSSVRLDTRRDGLTLDWTVPRHVDVIGPMALRLYVEAFGCDDVYRFAGVRKIHNGVESTFEGSYGFSGDMVTHGWQRAAFRELDERLSTPWQPVHTFSREQWPHPADVHVDVELRPQATRFRAGDTLRLEIGGTWSYVRKPFTGQFPSGYVRSPKGRLVVHAGGEHDAYLFIGTRSSLRESA